MNNVTIMGNLTRDPLIQSLPSGQSAARFSLALNRSYKDKEGNWQETTDFVDCVAYGQTADQVGEMTEKGQRLLVDGRLQSRTWKDDNGDVKSKLEVLASDVTFMEKPNRVNVS